MKKSSSNTEKPSNKKMPTKAKQSVVEPKAQIKVEKQKPDNDAIKKLKKMGFGI